MPLPSLFLLQSFKNNRKTQNLIKAMYFFPYSKWNANTKLFYRENLSSIALVTALGQGGHKQTRLFILSLSKSSKILNPNVRGETLIVSLFPIFCPTDLMLKNSGKFLRKKSVLEVSVLFQVADISQSFLTGLLQTIEAINYLSIFKYNPWPFSNFSNFLNFRYFKYSSIPSRLW